MNLPSFSFRIILGAIIIMMGVLALILALLSGSIHRDLVLNNTKTMMQEMISISAKERLKDLNQVSQDLGLALQSTPEFKRALKNKNYEKLIKLLNNQFHQYFVTAGVINLQQLVLFDRNLSLIMESTDGTVFFQNSADSICPEFFSRARKRIGSQRMKIIHDLCLYNKKPINLVAVPVGGLRLNGYIAVVTDPSHNFAGLENDLGMPVRLLQNDKEILYQSMLWPEREMYSLISSYSVKSNSNEDILTIFTEQNIEQLSASLYDARLKVFLITGLLTLFVIVLSIIIVRRSMLNPLTQFTDRLRHFNANQPNVIDDSKISGTKEIHEICEGFNYMANAQYKAQEADQQKSMFLANMSHEIRTPLTAIIGFSEKLYKDGKTAEWESLLERIILNSKHLYQLINDILDKSKIEANQLTIEMLNVSVASLIYEVDSLIGEKAISKGIKFDVTIDFPIPDTILSDPTRIKQILLNLCGNAIKFTEQGGISLRVSYYRDNIIFSIDDTGVGITAEQLNELFEPFTQADSSTTRKFGGTGLGLYISKQLVNKLGGEIQATSTPGEGSHFEVTLPVGKTVERWLTSKDEVLLQERTLETTVPELKGKILLAEDSPDNQRLVTLFIEETGASVEIACDGKQAVEKGLAEDFDLILMDMQMPEVDGIEAVRTLRHRSCTTPIAMLTANAMEENVVESEQAGANEFITKPINLDKFYCVLRKYLQEDNKPAKHALNQSMNNDRFNELFDMYINQLSGVISNFEVLLDRKDWETLKDELHRLKGTGGTFGFPEITEQCIEIEKRIKANQLAEAEQLIRVLNDNNRKICSEYEASH